MPSTATAARAAITLPRLPNEHPARYQARTEYILAGADRSLELVSQKLAKSLPLIKRWSAADHWAEHAARYDETVYTLAARDAADRYRADLADYRKRYGEAGKGLFVASVRLLDRINKTIATMDSIGPGALNLATNALKTAADLEALALRVEHLLGVMDAESGTE